MDRKSEFISAVTSISSTLRQGILGAIDELSDSCTEVRLRADMPVAFTCRHKVYYLGLDGHIQQTPDNTYICTREILKDTFARMCNYSEHTYHSDILSGFITLENGHRVGIAGTAVTDCKGKITAIRDISSLSIRIAGEVSGSADSLIEKIYDGSFRSTIIAGPPASGKTTILRDAVRQLSDRGIRICLLDERREIACADKGKIGRNVGMNTDVLSSYPKALGLDIALRTLSPQIIALDEVCTEEETEALSIASASGAGLLVTVHAGGMRDILNRRQIHSLIDTRAFDCLALLDGSCNKNSAEIFDIGELKDEIYRRRAFMGRDDTAWDKMLRAL